MVFPDYHFFAGRRLENHTIEKKRVNNLDDCELMCYLNDDCVIDLTTDANFYYRGSKVSYKSIFQNYRLWII